MEQELLGLALLGAGALLGMVGNWIKPPPKLGGGWAIALFVTILLVVGGLTYYNGRPDVGDRDGSGSDQPGLAMPSHEQSSLNPLGPNGGPSATSPPAPTAPAGAGGSPPASTARGGSGTVRTTPSAPPPNNKPATTSPYVPAERFQRFGGRHGSFTMAASGSQLRIVAPESIDNQWGGAIRDHHRCDVTIAFDVRLDAGPMDYYGFAVVPRGQINDDDQAQGSAMIFYRDSGDDFIAKYSSLPTPGIGGIGGGAYNVADLRKTHRVVVSARGAVHTVTVDGVPSGEYAETEPECGIPMIVAWGGVTAYVDRVLLS
ncbi:hypothetical protein BDK92_3789 [Micromonospora pisi]|uniref:Uncharacterized protein n=1 Tax=Micromonospora pisi TaxID=589240 RepID=A0A495JKT6_9ACTN|nr:hypothetical protein [Micromonospora pisi]RKR89441.1 hypothetical protein BDK92_3789 [Micromonospora pisi]